MTTLPVDSLHFLMANFDELKSNISGPWNGTCAVYKVIFITGPLIPVSSRVYYIAGGDLFV